MDSLLYDKLAYYDHISISTPNTNNQSKKERLNLHDF